MGHCVIPVLVASAEFETSHFCWWLHFCTRCCMKEFMFNITPLSSSLASAYLVVITAFTTVQAVVKANSQSNRNGQILTPRSSKTPERSSMKLLIYYYVRGMTTHANLWHCHNVGGPGEHVTCHVSVSWYTFLFFFFTLFFGSRTATPVDQFWWSIRYVLCFHARKCFMGSPWNSSSFRGSKPQFSGHK